MTGDVADGLDQGLGLGVVVHRSAADQLEGRPRIGVVVLGVVWVVLARRPLLRLRLGRCVLGLAPLLLLAGRSWRSAWGRFGPDADDLVAGRVAECPVDVPAECHAPQPSEWRARHQSHSDAGSTSRRGHSAVGSSAHLVSLGTEHASLGGVFPSRGRPFTSRRAERTAGNGAWLVQRVNILSAPDPGSGERVTAPWSTWGLHDVEQQQRFGRTDDRQGLAVVSCMWRSHVVA